MNDVTRLIRGFRTTQWIIDKQCEGLTHEESLLQLPFRGNCLNWVLGHLAQNRNQALDVLGLDLFGPDDLADRYGRGSEPLDENAEDVLALEELLDLLRAQQAALEGHLKQAPAATLDVLVGGDGERTALEVLSHLHWHETYHCGQLEILRQLTGTDDAVIP